MIQKQKKCGSFKVVWLCHTPRSEMMTVTLTRVEECPTYSNQSYGSKSWLFSITSVNWLSISRKVLCANHSHKYSDVPAASHCMLTLNSIRALTTGILLALVQSRAFIWPTRSTLTLRNCPHQRFPSVFDKGFSCFSWCLLILSAHIDVEHHCTVTIVSLLCLSIHYCQMCHSPMWQVRCSLMCHSPMCLSVWVPCDRSHVSQAHVSQSHVTGPMCHRPMCLSPMWHSPMCHSSTWQVPCVTGPCVWVSESHVTGPMCHRIHRCS